MPDVATTEIGAALRSAREVRGVSIEEAAWRTRIRREYLRALEEERFDAIGHAFARVHLHSYARFLSLDANAIVRDYVERYEREEPSPIERLNERHREAKRPPKPHWVVACAIAAAVLIAASVAGLVRGPGPRTVPSADQDALPTLPSSAQPAPAASAPGVVAPPAGTAPVTLVIVVERRCWVRVVSDGALAYEGTLQPGASETFTGRETLELVVGDAGAVRLILGGHDLGPPGKAGEVYRARFGPRGPLPAK